MHINESSCHTVAIKSSLSHPEVTLSLGLHQDWHKTGINISSPCLNFTLLLKIKYFSVIYVYSLLYPLSPHPGLFVEQPDGKSILSLGHGVLPPVPSK